MQPDDTPVIELVAEPPPRRDPFWGWFDLLFFAGILFGLIALILVTTGLISILSPSLQKDQTPLYLPVQLAFYAAIYFAFFLAFRIRLHQPVWSSLGWVRTVSNRTLAYIGLGGFVLSPMVSGIASLLHTPVVHMDMLDQLQHRPVILALFGVIAVTIAPLFEELLFRGFLQPLLVRTLGLPVGILLTSILFGLPHAFQYKFVWQYVVAVSLVGIVLGVVRYRTGSIITSTVMHACYNAFAATELFFPHK